MIDYGKFEKALRNLQVQFDHYRELDPSLPDFLQEAMAESVIQRFETAWDSLWKVLKRHLEEVIGLPEVPNGPKPILRLANENQLLPSPVERWIGYANARIATAHDYSGEKARQAIELMGDFIPDAVALYQRLTGRTWQ